MSGLRQNLLTNLPQRTITYTENLDLARFDSPKYRQELEKWFRIKYRGLKLDAIVPGGELSLDLALKLRNDLWLGVPIVFCSIPGEKLAQLSGATNLTGVVVEIDVKGTLAAAVQLCPDTCNIALIASDRGYTERYRYVRRQAEEFAASRYEFIPLTGLTMAQTKQRVANLPPKTVVVYLSMWMDAAGQVFNPRDALTDLSSVSTAPVFGLMDTHLGYGITGGSCINFFTLGNEVADQVARVVRAGSADGVPVVRSHANQLLLDFNELKRRNLVNRPLPARAEVRFKPPTLWESHRDLLLILLGALVLQSGLIAALLVQRFHRIRAESTLQEQRDQLAHVGRVSAMGQLASSLAHELNQPLGAILRNAEAGEMFLQQDPPDLNELRAILSDIRKDDERAGAVLDRIRSFLKRRNIRPGAVALEEVIAEVVSFVSADASSRQVQVLTEVEPGLPTVLGDRVQLQQVLLNLVLNAIDSISASHSRPRRVALRAFRNAQHVEVSVSDTGTGISAEAMQRLFEPFFTTRRHGMGIGLSISRTIIEVHGGRIWAENSPAGGAVFRFVLPVQARVESHTPPRDDSGTEADFTGHASSTPSRLAPL